MALTQVAISADEEPTAEKPHKYRILAVDDNKILAKTMMWTMEMLGHTAEIAHEGKSAIALAKSFHPDIVFLDIGLPGMNGYEICQAMRNEPVLQNTIFVALTGWGQKEHRERSKEAGFNYHLVKPVEIKTLENLLLVLGKEKF
jgi:CheY-like chemotaxis protein